jgi:hypothetical protein
LRGNDNIVLVNRLCEEVLIPTILIDSSYGSYLATKHLIDKGYKNIALVTGNEDDYIESEKIKGYKNALKENEIELLYFRNTPHHSVEWLVAKSADFLKIDIYTTERFVFPWLYTISRGYKKKRELAIKPQELNEQNQLRKHITNFVTMVSGNYDNAIPSYEKNRLGPGILKYYNPFKKPKQTIFRPHKFYSKTQNFFFYKKHSKVIDLKETDYFVFFLHYQPERTTLPEGFDFIDQFYAIKILSMLLPDSVKLIVKEHPSMFTNQSEPKSRSIHSYKSILKLKNVELISIETDSFQLIDNAVAIATITGTVALEAYIRKKPVSMFGMCNLKLAGVYGFETVDGLEKFISKIMNNSILIEDIVENLLRLCSGKAVSGIPKENPDEVDYHSARLFQENAHYKLLTKLLNSYKIAD